MSPVENRPPAAAMHITAAALRAQTAGSVSPGLLQNSFPLRIQIPMRIVIGLKRIRPQVPVPTSHSSEEQINVFRCVGSAGWRQAQLGIRMYE